MLSPRDTATRERRRSTGCGGSASTSMASGGARGGSPRGCRRHGGAGELQRHRRRPGGPRPRRRRLVPAHRPRAARLGGRAHRAALRVGDAPRHRLGRRRRGRRARGRLHALRGRRHRRSCTPGRGACASPCVVNNTLSLQTIPPGVVEDTPGGDAPAVLARLLQLRAAPPLGLALPPPPGPRRRHHRRHRPRRAPWVRSTTRSTTVDADGLEVADRPARRRGRRGRRRAPAPAAHSRVPDVHLWAPGRRLPLRPRGPARRRRRTSSSTATTSPSGSARSRSAAPSS